MAGGKYKAKKAKIAALRKKNVADIKAMIANLAQLKKEFANIDIAVEIVEDSVKVHRRYDQLWVEQLEAVLVELMFIEEDIASSTKKKDKQMVKQFKDEMKPLIKKEAELSKNFRNGYLWAAEEVRFGKEFIKWMKTMPSKNKPKGL